jgi:hypothetical protein
MYMIDRERIFQGACRLGAEGRINRQPVSN